MPTLASGVEALLRQHQHVELLAARHALAQRAGGVVDDVDLVAGLALERSDDVLRRRLERAGGQELEVVGTRGGCGGEQNECGEQGFHHDDIPMT